MFESESFDKPLQDHEYPDEYPDEGDYEHGEDYGEDDLVDCPECGAAIYDDAVRCPICGEYVTHGGGPWSGRSPLWIGLGVAGVIAVIVALVLH